MNGAGKMHPQVWVLLSAVFERRGEIPPDPLCDLFLAQLPQLAARSNEFRFERKAKFLKSFGVSLQTRV